MKKPTVAALMAEIETLKKRITELEARPPLVINNHPPVQPSVFLPIPQVVPMTEPRPYWGPKVGEVWCGMTAANPITPLWNGPRNPDGSCGQIGSAMLAASCSPS